MSLKLGSTAVSAAYLGTSAVSKIYLGTTEVYSSGGAATVPIAPVISGVGDFRSNSTIWTITWSAPNNGGSAILDYHVYFDDVDQGTASSGYTKEIPDGDNPINITVKARNVVGYSIASNYVYCYF